MLQEHVLALWTTQQTASFRVTPKTMRGPGQGSSASSLRLSADRPFIRELVDLLPCISSTSRRVSVTAASGAKYLVSLLPVCHSRTGHLHHYLRHNSDFLFPKSSLFCIKRSPNFSETSKGDDPLPFFFVCFFLHRLHDGGEATRKG